MYFIAISVGGNLGRKLDTLHSMQYGRLWCNYVYNVIHYLLLLCEIIHSFMHNIYTGLMRFYSGTFLIFFISRLIKKGSHL